MGYGFENDTAELSHTNTGPDFLAQMNGVFASRNEGNSCCLRTGAPGGSIGRQLTAAVTGPALSQNGPTTPTVA